MNDEKLAAMLYELTKYNQGAFAKKHKLTRQYINQLCNGKKPITARIAKLIKTEEAPKGYRKMKSWEPK